MKPMIRFFGRRKGKPISSSRERLMQELLPKVQLQLSEKGKIEVNKIFPFKPKELWLEIGFGGGEHVAELAKMYPDVGFIGAEPFLNGVCSLLAYLNGSHRLPQKETGLEVGRSDNVRIWPDDIRIVFPHLKDGVFERIFVLYPDPWPKARHAERRFIGQSNLPELYRLLTPTGRLFVATDVVEYAEWVKIQMKEFKKFKLDNRDLQQAPEDWVPTRYEQKGLEAGRKPIYFVFSKKKCLTRIKKEIKLKSCINKLNKTGGEDEL